MLTVFTLAVKQDEGKSLSADGEHVPAVGDQELDPLDQAKGVIDCSFFAALEVPGNADKIVGAIHRLV